MILDYRQKEDERTYKNAAGEDVKFQNTNLPGELLEYKPKFEGDDVDLEGATRDLKDMIKHFVHGRMDVIRRRYNYLLKKTRKQQENTFAILVVLDNLEEIIKIIRQSAWTFYFFFFFR
jgi:hypothetical protein